MTQPLIQENATVLFQGDSITDCWRDRQDPNDLGRGYAQMAAGWFGARYPERRVRFLNRGVGGDRVRDLRARWEQDALALRPDWVSILIGINDVWHTVTAGEPLPFEEIRDGMREILTRTRERTAARLILLEPFLVPAEPQDARRERLDRVIHLLRELAREFGAIYVPLDGLFAAACARREPEFWAPDCVHPSPAGHALIARAFLSALGAGE